MAAPRKGKDYSNGDNDNLEGETAVDEHSDTTSLLIVILSLVFVVVFGCALIGGVISGDPTNGFFITIVVASLLAISVAMVVSIRYIYANRARDDDAVQNLSKIDARGTLSSSDEENQYEEDYVNQLPRDQIRDYLIEPDIKDIQANSVVGEMSALSPHTYDEDSLSTFHHHIIKDHYKNGRQGFDFSRITQGEHGEKIKSRQDPPEGVGLATMEAAWNTRGNSKDPSAPKFSTDGKIIGDEDDRQDQSEGDRHDTEASESFSVRNDESPVTTKYKRNENDVDHEDNKSISNNHDEENTVATAKTHKSRRSSPKSRSPSTSRRTKSPSSASVSNSLSSKRNKTGKKTNHLNPPSSTKSGPINSTSASPVPPSPAASDTGSIASSFFSMFGKSQKSSSEIGASKVVSSKTAKLEGNVRKEKESLGKSNVGRPPMVRPPMMPPSIKKGYESMKTIDGLTGSVPSTPGNKSTFTIPPPRPIPRTPMGSEVFSEFQSVAGSFAASSTFDPKAHERALERMRKNQASIGASPVDHNAIPIYYNEDDDKESVAPSSVAPSSVTQPNALSYDIFAPPGSLGIVVDTTAKGCIVYSLKKSSPMQGLMNRGDLIIGLDNFDVRNMSASSLTKLMAKKSEQIERKFTMVPNNSD